MNTRWARCTASAKLEIDTMDTFVCSSWYYLRYPNPHLDSLPFDKDRVNSWLPVDQYVGGSEHAVMHLLYARFFTKVFHDLGYLDFDEPFACLRHQGTITNEGAKMSKSRGNVVNPDDFVENYGSDTFRMYMMFMGSYEEGGDWHDEGIQGIERFVKRVWRLVHSIHLQRPNGEETKKFVKVERQMHHAIKYCTQSLSDFHFNTGISRIMELVNEIYLYIQDVNPKEQNKQLWTCVVPNLLKLFAPFCPHLSEELWQVIGRDYSIVDTDWPEYDEKALKTSTVQLGVQVNGKIRGQINVDADADQESIIKIALENNKVRKYTDGKKIVKSLVIPHKLVVFAVK